jgi:hypothetical protein
MCAIRVHVDTTTDREASVSCQFDYSGVVICARRRSWARRGLQGWTRRGLGLRAGATRCRAGRLHSTAIRHIFAIRLHVSTATDRQAKNTFHHFDQLGVIVCARRQRRRGCRS